MAGYKLLSFTIIILPILISLNNAETVLDTIKTNITLTTKIIKLDLEGTKNDLRTTINNLEQQIDINDITKLLNTLPSKLQEILTANQLTTINAAISDALNIINAIRNAVLDASTLLKNTIDDLAGTIARLNSLSSLESILQDASVRE